MDTDETGQPETPPGRRRARTAAVVAAAVLAIPGGVLISNAVAASGDGATGSSQAQSTTPAPYGDGSAPYGRQGAPKRGDRDGHGPRAGGHRGDCPGMGSGTSGSSGGGQSGTAAPTGYALQ